jgi:signal peptidase I
MGNEKTIQIKEMQDELFQKNRKGWFRIISGSMSPLIEINDRALVKKVDTSEIKLGDIILFKNDGTSVTHRVIRFSRQDGIVLVLQKGDASNYASFIPYDDVIGKVITIEKKGKFLNLNSYQGRVINGLLGWKNYISYRLDLSIGPVKQYLRDKPGFIFVRALYRIMKKPFRYMHRIIVRIVFFPKFLS